MECTCLIGESNMSDFTPWWESHHPAWIIVYCLDGEAELTLEFKPRAFRQGMIAIIAPDMFPSFGARSENFNSFYCLVDRDSAENLFHDFPKHFFNAIYAEPVVPAGRSMDRWMDMLNAIGGEQANKHRQAILFDLMHALILDY